MPIHSEDARAFHEHIEQATAAPGEVRDVELPECPHGPLDLLNGLFVCAVCGQRFIMVAT